MGNIRDIVARNCARLLEESSLKYVEIARLVGVSNTTLQRWKSGIHPPEIDNLEKLAEVLGVDPWEFYQHDSPTPREIKPPPASSVIKMFLSIPDEVYEKARHFPPDHLVWKEVMISLEGALADMGSDGGNGEGVAGHGA